MRFGKEDQGSIPGLDMLPFGPPSHPHIRIPPESLTCYQRLTQVFSYRPVPHHMLTDEPPDTMLTNSRATGALLQMTRRNRLD
jgi:hypothetical protein